MHIIDTHTHIYGEEFDDDRAAVVQRAREAGVIKALLPNIDSTTIARVMDMCREYPDFCRPMMGLHPTSVTASNLMTELGTVRKCVEENRPSFVAIGEIGIDLYWDSTYINEQIEAFEEQIRWALEFDLPAVIHCRKAFGHIKAVLDRYKGTGLRGVFHSFTADEPEVQDMLSFENFFLGINGIVTFKKSALPAVLPSVPLSRILLETDSPYLAPAPNRGKRNETSFVGFVLDKVAGIYGLTPHEVAEQTTANAVALFGNL